MYRPAVWTIVLVAAVLTWTGHPRPVTTVTFQDSDVAGPHECNTEPVPVEALARIVGDLATPDGLGSKAPPPSGMVEVSGSPHVEDVTVDGTPIVIDGTMVASRAGSAAAPDAAMPAGAPADEATAAEVARAVRQYTACSNTGDALRVYALFTEHGLKDLLDNVVPEDEQGFITSVSTPVIVPTEALQPVPDIESVQQLDDGRVAAAIVVAGPSGAGTRQVFIFSKESGRWLIDQIIFAGTRSTGATPGA
jgi:hypothetical protein